MFNNMHKHLADTTANTDNVTRMFAIVACFAVKKDYEWVSR